MEKLENSQVDGGNKPVCAMCGKIIEGEVFEVENSEGKMVPVDSCCFQNCYYTELGKYGNYLRVTPKRYRESIKNHRVVLPLSWVNEHKDDLVPLLEDNDITVPKHIALQVTFLVKDGDDFKQVDGYTYSYSTEVCHCPKCKGKRYAFDGNIDWNELHINGRFYCPDAIKNLNIVVDFLGNKCLKEETVKFEGHLIDKRAVNEFENYSWKRLNCYHDSPLFLPITKSRKINNFCGLGFELETVGDYIEPDYDDDYEYNYARESAQMIRDLDGEFPKTFYFNTDGSLDDERDGVEIISRACDWNYWNNFDFDGFTRVLDRNYRSSGTGENADCCGMHIHASANYYGKTYETRVKNIAKIVLFFKYYEKELSLFAGRNYNHYCDTLPNCSNLNDAEILIHNGYSRYSAINLCNFCNQNNCTVEFRIFDGTTSSERIKTNLEFVHFLNKNICKYREQSDFLDCKKLFDGCSNELKERLIKAKLLKDGDM